MSELQQAVSRNVRVLMAIRGVRSQSALAKKVGVEYSNFNDKMRGKNSWTLSDIEMLADEFRIPAASLLGDGREFLNPNLRATGTGDMPGATFAYVSAEEEFRLIPFPQVRGRSSLDAPVLDQVATVILLASHRATTSLPVAI